MVSKGREGEEGSGEGWDRTEGDGVGESEGDEKRGRERELLVREKR